MNPIATNSRLPTIATPRDLRAYLDAAIGTLEIFSAPRAEALLHVFRAIQSLQTANEVGSHLRGHLIGGYNSMRASQDVLRWLTYKIFERCPRGGDLRRLSFGSMPDAFKAINDLAGFSHLQDAIISAEAGFVECIIDKKNRTVRFLPDPKIYRQQARRIIREDAQRQALLQQQARNQVAIRSSRFDRALGELLSSVKVDSGKQVATYRMTGRILRAFSGSIELPQPQLPTSLSLGPYLLSDFWIMWRHLVALSSIHSAVIHSAAMPPGNAFVTYNSAQQILRQDSLLKQLRHYTSLRYSVASEILRDLTYDPQIPWTDVMYQPLIPLYHKQLMALPLLVLGSNPERNLLAIIDRLEPRREGAARLKEIREQIMIEEIKEAAETTSLRIRPRVQLGPSSSRVGDIDLFIWDRSGHNALAISLKWFYGADSMHEVVRQDERFRDGIGTHRQCIKYFNENMQDVSQRYRLVDITPETRLSGVLVSKVGLPSEALAIKEIPVVTSDRFIQVLNETGDDVRAMSQRLHEKADKEHYPEFRLVDLKFQLGDYKFGIPQIASVSPEGD